ncbi:MAG: transporter, partial [Bacteroidales bacterium]|nr:transporter [Bacteroidales bacterium]
PQMPAGGPQGFPQGGGGGMPPSGGRPGGGGGRGMAPPSGGGMPPSAQPAPAPVMLWVKEARMASGK